MQEVAEWTERIKETSQRHHVLRQAINKMNDESRISSFELNNVPIYAIDDFDRDVVLSQFASAIGSFCFAITYLSLFLCSYICNLPCPHKIPRLFSCIKIFRAYGIQYPSHGISFAVFSKN